MPNTRMAPETNLPWFWEGNVQSSVITHLQQEGYTIIRSANTRKREHAKDIEAEKNGERVWVTVTGYPHGGNKSQYAAQTRDWFSAALLDILDWRGQDANSRLALALPDFRRYRRLAQKISWLLPLVPFSFLWVGEDGTITTEQVSK